MVGKIPEVSGLDWFFGRSRDLVEKERRFDRVSLIPFST